MAGHTWRRDRRKHIVCLDSYQDGVPKGRIYDSQLGMEHFSSLLDFFLKMESILDEIQLPQSYTDKRLFLTGSEPMGSKNLTAPVMRGARATFEVQVIFRQHTSWQGVIVWLETGMEQSFRSALELVLLMDSALNKQRGCDTA